MAEINIKLSEDQVIVLFEFFERFEHKGKMCFVHQAEYLALMRLAGQLEYPTVKIINTDQNHKSPFEEIVKKARERIAEGFESDFPKVEIE